LMSLIKYMKSGSDRIEYPLAIVAAGGDVIIAAIFQ